MSDRVFFIVHIRRIITIAGKLHLNFIHSSNSFMLIFALVILEYLTCRKITSHVDSNCVLRKPSCHILRHKSFIVYLISNSFQTFCDRNYLRHRRVH
jgi:hypothetical protein